MAEEGSKLTRTSNEAAAFLLEQLESVGQVTAKRMFGANGIFHAGKMFGIIDSKGNSYLKADDTTKADFDAAGSEQHSRMPYFSIPADVLKNKKKLIVWANKSIAISK